MPSVADENSYLANFKKEEASALALLRKESLDLFNRLHSIAEDIKFVEHVRNAYSDLPILPNLRCGAWYVDPQYVKNAAYFKSTDGHTNNWSFNLRRPNLHLLSVVQQHGGFLLVDSTRAGKRMPDALSKTVPVWCAVLNRAIKKLYNKSDEWNTKLYCPPGVVSAQEHHRIESKLDEWTESLLGSSYNLPELARPLRPIWITPSTSTFTVFLTGEDRKFAPVVCVSASKQIHEGLERRMNGFSYVQGSGDDHELWGEGLTPDIFWDHKDQLLSADRSKLSGLVEELVNSNTRKIHQDWINLPTAISKVGGRLLISSVTDIPESLPAHLPHSERKLSYVLISDKFLSTDSDEEEENVKRTKRKDILKLKIAEGKKGQTDFLHTVLPQSIPFIQTQLEGGSEVCICCHNGKDASVGVGLAALQKFFDDDGRYIADKAQQEKQVSDADKKSISTRLQWIISSRPQANPARVTLKRVNEFLLTSATLRR
ncbi:tRNA A64-2'-O-ribosylphosphate transferase [Abortiporus biennis]